jgi:hypothetical protein
LQSFLKAKTEALDAELIEGEAELDLWAQARECRWAAEGSSLVKVPLSPKQIPALEEALPAGAARRYSAGGHVAWLAAPGVDELDGILARLELPGLVLWGVPGRPYLGPRKGLSLARRVKQALDPAGKFLEP